MTTEGTFQVVRRNNKPKQKVKTTIDLTTARKTPALPRFALKDSSITEEYPKLWKGKKICNWWFIKVKQKAQPYRFRTTKRQ